MIKIENIQRVIYPIQSPPIQAGRASGGKCKGRASGALMIFRWERAQCRRTHTLTSTVAAISQATAASASDASRRMRSTSTYSVAR